MQNATGERAEQRGTGKRGAGRGGTSKARERTEGTGARADQFELGSDRLSSTGKAGWGMGEGGGVMMTRQEVNKGE